jgi:hypothetical protein
MPAAKNGNAMRATILIFNMLEKMERFGHISPGIKPEAFSNISQFIHHFVRAKNGPDSRDAQALKPMEETA